MLLCPREERFEVWYHTDGTGVDSPMCSSFLGDSGLVVYRPTSEVVQKLRYRPSRSFDFDHALTRLVLLSKYCTWTVYRATVTPLEETRPCLLPFSW